MDARCQHTLLAVEQLGKSSGELGTALRHHVAALEEQASDLVHQRRPIADQPVAHAMERLHVELLLRLQRHEAHGGPARGLGDRLGIAVVVLLRFHVGPHVLG